MILLSLHNAEDCRKANAARNAQDSGKLGRGVQGYGRCQKSLASDHAGRPKAVLAEAREAARCHLKTQQQRKHGESLTVGGVEFRSGSSQPCNRDMRVSASGILPRSSAFETSRIPANRSHVLIASRLSRQSAWILTMFAVKSCGTYPAKNSGRLGPYKKKCPNAT